MSLDWMPREGGVKDHNIWGMEHFGTEAPCTMYEEKPIIDPSGKPVEGLYSAWITLNNPAQYNSYTTEMVKGVIAGFHRAQMNRSVVAVVFTGTGDKAFCTGGNTKEYSEYYSTKPTEYAQYMELFNGMVDSILMCQKPVIRRKFLEMERRTAVERLQALTELERTEVVQCARWTQHPEEPWTARKVLRRFLEHEREHIAQARQILLNWWDTVGRRAKRGPKEGLLGALTVVREELLSAMATVPPEGRETTPVGGEWTLKDVVAHIVAWERLGAEGLRHMGGGRTPQVEHVTDIDAWNAAQCEACRDQSWDHVWSELHATRMETVDALEAITLADLHKIYPFPWGEEGTAYDWVGVYVDHDWEHARELMNARSWSEIAA